MRSKTICCMSLANFQSPDIVVLTCLSSFIIDFLEEDLPGSSTIPASPPLHFYVIPLFYVPYFQKRGSLSCCYALVLIYGSSEALFM